ncbi:tRNA (adenosine(37)-N6)-threonylcarbamoyltransferase complex ATPase subunit type 1 TsaE [Methylobacillus arboreus]|uniref:tRNA (adenosine(37)-N6)-threonylcarbamoyltransferase complex ATPase subunit type 1 TsaE n=1 Tax=Methylobacillus arboreus TaxID=755170 RepID=UPI001E5AF892|nr:tRNA (adenosine(37)-N6)-threonylcarbamoyltransferase complex ATPase subunit type 1 TsaE [Methylobacillus arboreus]MCB5189844.1 tRNA (adenosine(37)-N6)-threonylcarbamoyltransferase complex ATPase subunit type 1 TsaE [Methylobacillus arboreus]
MHDDFTLALPDEAATLAFGSRLAQVLTPGLNIYLHGDLGAGKTTLVRGLLRALGHTGKVKSPTYTLVEPYVVSTLNLYHFDLYRFVDPEEWDAAGFRDYFNPESLCLVEWPEKAQELLPAPDIDIRMQPEEQGRRILASANTDSGKQCLIKLKSVS